MKRDIELEATLVAKYAVVAPVLDERSRRRWAAAESLAIGYGGDAVVSSATGLARETIRKGRREIARDEAPTDRIRRPGGGRPRIQQDQPGIQAALEALVDPLTRGDPTSPLRWTCKSRAKLAAALTEQGWRVSSTTVGRLLHRLGYRLQSPRKRQEGATHPDRNAQFEHINQTADKHLRAGQPVISVDTKKKELVGNFKNGGREWQPKGTPPAVLVHDFPTDAEGKAIPYGIYDMARNEAFVSVGWDHDTPAFAVASIRQWWRQMGSGAYPEATTLFITADAGGSNGYRSHAWKHELQQLADETGLAIEVSHFPPGTSKWNKIEHRLFCHITANWRGTPLTTYETIVDRIGNVRTATGLQVRAELDIGEYPTGVKVTKEQMDTLAPVRDAFHGVTNCYPDEVEDFISITVLTTSNAPKESDAERGMRDIVPLSWDDVRGFIRSLLDDQENFADGHVRDFVKRYLDIIGEKLLNVGDDLAERLRNGHQRIFEKLQNDPALLDEVGEPHRTTIERWIEYFQPRWTEPREIVAGHLERRGGGRIRKSSGRGGWVGGWLYWWETPSVKNLGIDDCACWLFSFEPRKVTVELGTPLERDPKNPKLREIWRFLEDTPIDPGRPERYPTIVKHRVIYRHCLLKDAELWRFEESVKLLHDSMDEFFGQDGDYERVERYLKCLAFDPRGPQQPDGAGEAESPTPAAS